MCVPGETIGETFGETFAQGLPILFPFIQGLSGRLWGDGVRFFRYHDMTASRHDARKKKEEKGKKV